MFIWIKVFVQRVFQSVWARPRKRGLGNACLGGGMFHSLFVGLRDFLIHLMFQARSHLQPISATGFLKSTGGKLWVTHPPPSPALASAIPCDSQFARVGSYKHVGPGLHSVFPSLFVRVQTKGVQRWRWLRPCHPKRPSLCLHRCIGLGHPV